jgi:hypothetical protein
MVEHPLPRPEDCGGERDEGKLLYDEAMDVWYECRYDRRTSVYTWVILPPEDTLP